MKSNFKGIISALSSGIFWGLDTTLNSLILMSAPFILAYPRLISATLLLAFFHDLLSALILLVDLIVTKTLAPVLKKLKSRSVQFVMIAALFAGPLGMRAYLYAVENLGSGLAATISAIYPAVAAVLGAIFLKDALNLKGWLGLGLTISAISILGFTNISLGKNIIFGVLSAILCVLGWAAESVITSYGMKDDLEPRQALFIRQWVSSLAYLTFMLFEGDVIYSIQLVLSSSHFWMIVVMAIIGTLSYRFYYSAINQIGPVKATGLNVTYSIWAILFSLILLGGQWNWSLILCGILIVIGSALIVKE